MKLYDMVADPEAYPRWYLSKPIAEGDVHLVKLDAREFTSGVPYTGRPPIVIPLSVRGPHFDFNFAAFDMIVTPARFNKKLLELVGPETIELWPVKVEDQIEPMEILNIINVVDCLDYERSDCDIWTENDHRSDLAGKARGFGPGGMVLDVERARGEKLFRLKDWLIAPIANDEVKSLMEQEGITGVAFNLVGQPRNERESI